MKSLTLYCMILCLGLLGSYKSYSQEYKREVIELWKAGRVPFNKENIELEEKIDAENKRFTQISNPVIFLFRNEENKKPGPALLFCPGGGYERVTIGQDRGESYAKLFFSMGFNVVAVLKYRLPDSRIVSEPDKAPLCDAQKALSILHRNAAKWKIDRKKIGVMGGSAGGHVAASLANLSKDIYAPGVKPKQLSQAFSILLFPVISFNLPYRHEGSYQHLLADKVQDQNLIDYFSLEKQVNPDTPPTFLAHATDDRAVPYQNSLIYAEQLQKYGVPYKYIQLNKGGHGFGLDLSRVDQNWMLELEEWLNAVLKEIR